MSECDLLQHEPVEQQIGEGSQQPALRLVGRRQALAKLLLVVAGCLVALVLGEITVRIFAAVTHRVQLVVSDGRAGWVLLSNLHDLTRGGEGGRFVINTDSEGHRITRRASEPISANRPTIIVVGDSFVQSTGVDDAETFPWIVASEMPVNVVNLGVLGYGTDQELVNLDAYLQAHSTIDVRDVVVLVCTNDFMDVQTDFHYLARTKPRFHLVDGRLVRPAFRLRMSDHLMDASYLYWLLNSKYAEYLFKGPNEPALGVDLVVACVDAMREIVTRRGARLHVLAHHLKELQPLGESRWAEFCRRAGAVDITERLRPPNGANPFCYDGHHWSVEVQQRAAALLKERLEAPIGTPNGDISSATHGRPPAAAMHNRAPLSHMHRTGDNLMRYPLRG